MGDVSNVQRGASSVVFNTVHFYLHSVRAGAAVVGKWRFRNAEEEDEWVSGSGLPPTDLPDISSQWPPHTPQNSRKPAKTCKTQENIPKNHWRLVPCVGPGALKVIQCRIINSTFTHCSWAGFASAQALWRHHRPLLTIDQACRRYHHCTGIYSIWRWKSMQTKTIWWR